MDNSKWTRKKRFFAGVTVLCVVAVVIIMHIALFGSLTKENDRQYIERSDYYAIYRTNDMFFCSFYDKDGNTVKTDGPFIRQPHIKTVYDKLLRVTWQSGTGMGTQFAYYFDIEQSRFSELFRSVFDEYCDNVVYCTDEKVIVQNIFNKDDFYLEITEFEKPFSAVAFPFENICFTDRGKKLSITYYSGDDYKTVTEYKLIQ